MGIATELHNIGDAELCREIVARIEHAFSERPGDWGVSIAGSRETDNWELKIQGQNGFERSYTLSGANGEHEPDAILRLVRQLVPAAP
jgi:hypothetical protein